MDVVALLPILCQGFLGTAAFSEGTLIAAEHLNRSELNYSVASLKHVDEWIGSVRTESANSDEQSFTNTVMAAGCYVGEVIKRNTSGKFAWASWSDSIGQDAKLSTVFPFGMGTAAVLVGTDGSFTLPINKVGRAIEEGPENNLEFYARGYVESDE